MVEIVADKSENLQGRSVTMRFLQPVLQRLKMDGDSLDSGVAAIKVLLIRCTGALAAYASQVILARLLGQSEYGIFALVWVWVLMLGHLSPLGVTQIVCRYVPHYFARDQHDLLRGFLSSSSMLVFVFAAIAAVLGATGLWFARPWLDNIYLLPFVVALLVFPLIALQDYVENLARAFNWQMLAIAPPYVVRHGLIGLGMIGVAISDLPATAWVAVCVTFAATLISLTVQAFLVSRKIRKLVPSGPRQKTTSTWLKTALPFVFVDGAAILFSNADILILALFVDPSAIAIYFAASRILQLVAFVPYAATAATAQRFSALNALNDQAGLRNLARNTTRFTFIVALAAAGFIYLIAPFLLNLFGPGFDEAMPVLLVLMIGLIVQSFAGPGEDLLTMLGHERVCAVSSALSLVLNIVLNLMLIPVYGVLIGCGNRHRCFHRFAQSSIGLAGEEAVENGHHFQSSRFRVFERERAGRRQG